MDLNKLRTFYVLAQTRNYSACARKLCVTQSAVSHAIKKLESSLGLELLERTRKGCLLTHEGRILFQTCCTVFFELEKARDELADSSNYPEVIRLGSTVEFGISIVLKNMQAFYRQHPNIHIDFRLSHNLIEPLLNDEMDMIIDCRPHSRPELEIIPLFREEYVVIASAQYIRENQVHEPTDLARCNILSMDKELVWWHNFISVLPPARRNIFYRVTEINHIRGIINAAHASLGVGFVPRYTVLKDLEEGRLVELFPDLDLLNDDINIYLKRDRRELPKCVALIEYIKGFRLQ